jgi:hypothetical protein
MEGWKKYRLEEITNVKGSKLLPKSEKLNTKKELMTSNKFQYCQFLSLQ